MNEINSSNSRYVSAESAEGYRDLVYRAIEVAGDIAVECGTGFAIFVWAGHRYTVMCEDYAQVEEFSFFGGIDADRVIYAEGEIAEDLSPVEQIMAYAFIEAQ